MENICCMQNEFVYRWRWLREGEMLRVHTLDLNSNDAHHWSDTHAPQSPFSHSLLPPTHRLYFLHGSSSTRSEIEHIKLPWIWIGNTRRHSTCWSLRLCDMRSDNSRIIIIVSSSQWKIWWTTTTSSSFLGVDGQDDILYSHFMAAETWWEEESLVPLVSVWRSCLFTTHVILTIADLGEGEAEWKREAK